MNDGDTIDNTPQYMNSLIQAKMNEDHEVDGAHITIITAVLQRLTHVHTCN